MDFENSVGIWDKGPREGESGLFLNLTPPPSIVVFAEEINQRHGNIYKQSSEEDVEKREPAYTVGGNVN